MLRPDADAPVAPLPAAGGTLPFFALAFAITWALQIPAVLALRGVLPGPVERLMPFAGLGVFGPMLAALLLARVHPSGGGLRALVRPLRPTRAHAGLYLLALVLPGALLTGGLVTYQLLGGHDVGPWAYPPRDAQRIAAVLIIPFAEELGWRGFALPRLLARHGSLRANVLLGVVWAVWHVPMLMLASVPLGLMPLMIVFFVAGSVVFGWFYQRTGGSLLVVVLAHAGAHLNNSHLALPANTTPFLVHTAAHVACAIGLVLSERRRASRLLVGTDRARLRPELEQ